MKPKELQAENGDILEAELVTGVPHFTRGVRESRPGPAGNRVLHRLEQPRSECDSRWRRGNVWPEVGDTRSAERESRHKDRVIPRLRRWNRESSLPVLSTIARRMQIHRRGLARLRQGSQFSFCGFPNPVLGSIEGRKFSPAFTDSFLPRRKDILVPRW